jgi:hypothetical protein
MLEVELLRQVLAKAIVDQAAPPCDCNTAQGDVEALGWYLTYRDAGLFSIEYPLARCESLDTLRIGLNVYCDIASGEHLLNLFWVIDGAAGTNGVGGDDGKDLAKALSSYFASQRAQPKAYRRSSEGDGAMCMTLCRTQCDPGKPRTLGLDWRAWSFMLRAARSQGWRPAGTLFNREKMVAIIMEVEGISEDEARAQAAEYEQDWDGNYQTNDYQLVTPDDAVNLAASLEAALPDIPLHDACPPGKLSCDLEGRIWAESRKWPPVSPLEGLSGPYRSDVLRFIPFAKDGAFEIG